MDVAELKKSASRATSLLKALSNPSRLLILCQLAEGEKSVSELQQQVGVSQSGLSQHLAVLRRKGIVATRREAQSIYYSLASQEAAAVMTTLYVVFCAKASTKPHAARLRQGLVRGTLPRARMA
ncbi:MAG: winged helix-turn-helix transcriptional regulator [Betaproteobacteria bacterium]|nr:winged helix-turn-helix transcriptional regulator [Betaproteobacteria bacterium]